MAKTDTLFMTKMSVKPYPLSYAVPWMELPHAPPCSKLCYRYSGTSTNGNLYNQYVRSYFNHFYNGHLSTTTTATNLLTKAS